MTTRPDETIEALRALSGELARALRRQEELGLRGVPVASAEAMATALDGLVAPDAQPPRGSARPPNAASEAPRGADRGVAAGATSGSAPAARPVPVPADRSPGGAPSGPLPIAPGEEPPWSRTGELRSSLLPPPPPRVDPPKAPGASPIDASVPRGASAVDASIPRGPSVETLEDVRRALGDCQRCGLCRTRTRIVWGVGNARARLMFVGEAPGFDEDRLGEPFVGQAGQLLTKMIAAMGLTRDDVYIANVLKCRPPENRDPAVEEVLTCLPFLKRQIAAVRPEVICTLGRHSAGALLDTDTPVGRLRGTWQSYDGIPLMPTWHPAYLLRQPAAKKDAWSDLQQVMARLGLRGPRAGGEGE